MKIVFFGDSITAADRDRSDPSDLGSGYVGILYEKLKNLYESTDFEFLNRGIGGDRVRDLEARVDADVVAERPDIAVVLVGINDVWRQYDTPEITEGHVYTPEYQETLSRLVETTLPEVKRMVLMTPYIIEPNREDPMRARMDEYGRIVKEIAGKNDIPCVDLQAAFDRYCKEYYPASINWDRIHPNTAGHCIIARALLNAIGFEWK